MSKREFLYKLNLKNPWHFLALGLGSGLAPVAPGTFGSLAAIPFCYLLMLLPLYAQLALIVLVFFLGIKACNEAEKAMGIHDHGGIVIDEFVGMFIAVQLLPVNIYSLILAFVLFRFFDVLKPWPVCYFDKKVAGGLGIMLDDVMAGLYALMVAHLGLYLYFLYFV